MKIGNSPDGIASPPKAERRAEAAAAPPSIAAAPPSIAAVRPSIAAAPPSAQVAISSAAQLAASAGADDGSFDAAKVQRISQAISEGKFTVDADAIADKLVANAQELLSAPANKH
ncbi:flagellar biosynthesis anti-sigma factor FlgM [Pelomonas aquatica]|jgi:negative regulator of flagellin synthesis FlgM|uniref:Negative regulator of flagellin synthesis n=1 Tax=Pelomonas aquatica TaxID=431058 RepID=A0A9X4LNE9_9BURK|nr:flagellar biosynthesis anti-sigma factor FlgM [Pelomonas aquatica]MCY4756183.1 flagellar biosynthesis anti-sigma factor FlgM [Pelomonas aquatica]MDG0863468.1 flagellar biosynthesis anti-sigma factor FlgM [Pelomonas aquatica]